MSDATRAGIRLDTRPLWRLRASVSLTRWVLYAVAAIGVAATARYTVAPPRPATAPAAPAPAADRAAEGFATLFARRYLTWDAASPLLHEQGLSGFLGAAVDPDAGLGMPPHGSQRVGWAEVVQAVSPGMGEHVYTVVADTGRPTPTYLSVDVVRGAGGELRLGRYPALVGPPLIQPATALDAGAGGEVTDQGAANVVERALRNYLDGSGQNLAADLAPGSLVATPVQRLALDHVAQLRGGPSGEVLATVAVHDSVGTSYTLTYQLELLRSTNRWLVGAIQSDPRT